MFVAATHTRLMVFCPRILFADERERSLAPFKKRAWLTTAVRVKTVAPRAPVEVTGARKVKPGPRNNTWFPLANIACVLALRSDSRDFSSPRESRQESLFCQHPRVITSFSLPSLLSTLPVFSSSSLQQGSSRLEESSRALATEHHLSCSYRKIHSVSLATQ